MESITAIISKFAGMRISSGDSDQNGTPPWNDGDQQRPEDS